MKTELKETVIKSAPKALTIGLYLVYFYYLSRYAVNIPYWDEWIFLSTEAFGTPLSWDWLFQTHNEHRIVLTKLLNWILFKTTNWNIRISILLNWLIFGFLLMVVYRFQKTLELKEKETVLCFFPFLLSTLAIDNFTWGFQSGFHFFLIFFFTAVIALFRNRLTPISAFAGISCALLSAYSLSAGFACCFVLLIFFNLWKILERKQEAKIKLSRTLSACVTGLGLAGLLAWTIGYTKPLGHLSLLFPYHSQFYTYFFHLLSSGFGIKYITASSFERLLSLGVGMLGLLWTLIPLFFLFRNPASRSKVKTWALGTAIFGILASLVVITMRRAQMGSQQAKSPRYAEIGMLLIPLSVMAWQLCLERKPALCRRVLVGSWVILFLLFAKHWGPWPYRLICDARLAGLKCIASYYKNGTPAHCGELYPHDLSPFLERAKELNISFYSELIRQNHEN